MQHLARPRHLHAAVDQRRRQLRRRRSKINKPGQWKDNPDPDDLLPPKNARIAASTSAPLVFNPIDNSLNYIVQNNVNRATSGADISFTKSMDYGNTWSDMTTVSVTGSGAPAPRDQFFPWMDVDPEGNLHAIWFDNRNDPQNLLINTFQGDSTRRRRDLGEPQYQYRSRGTRT